MTEAQKIIIKVYQLPPAECSPNSRVHWTVRKLAGDCFGNEVFYIARCAGNEMVPLHKAKISLTLVVKQHRRRDLDNWWARFKPGADALVRAGVLGDDDIDHLQHGEITVEVDKARAPMTIITIESILREV